MSVVSRGRGMKINGLALTIGAVFAAGGLSTATAGADVSQQYPPGHYNLGVCAANGGNCTDSVNSWTIADGGPGVINVTVSNGTSFDLLRRDGGWQGERPDYEWKCKNGAVSMCPPRL